MMKIITPYNCSENDEGREERKSDDREERVMTDKKD